MISKINGLIDMYNLARTTPIFLEVILAIIFMFCILFFASRKNRIVRYHLNRLNKNIRSNNFKIGVCTLIIIVACIIILLFGSLSIDEKYNNPTINKLNRIECAYQAPKNIKHNERKLKLASEDFSDFDSIQHLKHKINHEKAMHKEYHNFNIKKIHKPTAEDYL